MRSLVRAPLILVLAFATIALSLVGNYGFLPRDQWPDPIDWLVRTIDLFKMGTNVPKPTPWPIEIARFTGATFTLSVLAKVWVQLFREQIAQFRLSYWRGHVVICGLGRKGLQLAREFRQQNYRVAATETSLRQDYADVCRREGIIVEVGDATKPYTLEQIGIQRARYVFAVCQDDHTNLEVAMETLLRLRACGLKGRLNCYVHVINLRLRVLLQRHELLRDRPAGFELRIFNVLENTARALLADHPPERSASGQVRRVHVVVIGLTPLGEAVVTQVARVGHYANRLPTRVTVLDEQTEERGESFLASQPGLGESCELRLVQIRLTESRFTQMKFLDEEFADEHLTIVLCFDQDEENISLALRLAEQRREAEKLPIFARVSEHSGLAKLVAASSQELAGKGIRPFGAIEEVCGWEILREDYFDSLAKGFHQYYIARYEGMPPWEELSEDLRNSNRAAADHVDVKLRAIGCARVKKEEIPPDTPIFDFTREEIELLSEMEHRRWSADRFLSGWTLGPRDDIRKTRPNLVLWEQLDEDGREKNRQQVRALPAVLALKGFAIRRLESSRLPLARDGGRDEEMH